MCVVLAVVRARAEIFEKCAIFQCRRVKMVLFLKDSEGGSEEARFLDRQNAGVVRGGVRSRLQRLPSGIGVFLLGIFFLSTTLYGGYVGGRLESALHWAGIKAGFPLQNIRIWGQEHVSERELHRALALDKRQKQSLLFYDVHAARVHLLALPWVAGASVHKLYPKTLHVRLQEYKPFALWQKGRVFSVIDKTGHVITQRITAEHAGLPLAVGTGAAGRISEFLEILEDFPELRARMQAAVFIAERRWNLLLEEGITLRLPEVEIDTALKEIVSLDKKTALLSRGLLSVDLRLPDRIVLRMPDKVAEEWRKFFRTQTGQIHREADT